MKKQCIAEMNKLTHWMARSAAVVVFCFSVFLNWV